MADVFLSYAREDEARAAALASVLVDLGWSVFWDRRIVAGSSWDEVIEREIRASKCMVVLWSVASVKSRWVKIEASAAAQRAMLVPANLDDSAPPLQFSFVQSAQLRSWTGSVDHSEFVLLTDGISQHVQPWSSRSRPTPTPPRLSPVAAAPQRARIELEKARHEYRQRVDETLSDHQISIGERDTLDELRRRLGLSQEDADEIEVEAHKPITAYAETIEEYKKTLRKHIAQRYPLQDDQRKDLELRKRDLGLKDEDAAATEALVLAEVENDHKAQRAAMAAEAREIDRRNKARQRAADALLSATAAVEKKQFAIARKHVAAARAADPEHPDVAGWDARISDAAEGARREAESELNSAIDAVAKKQFAIAEKHVAAAWAADPEHDFEGWAKTIGNAVEQEEALHLIEAIHRIEAIPTSPHLTPDETLRAKLVGTALVAFKGLNSFFLAPEIPAEKSQNARSRCQIPPTEELLAILDLTTFGSAKNCWAFTDVALYYRSAGEHAMLKYEDFPQFMFQSWLPIYPWVAAKTADGRCILFDTATALSKKQGIAILDAIKTAVSG